MQTQELDLLGVYHYYHRGTYGELEVTAISFYMPARRSGKRSGKRLPDQNSEQAYTLRSRRTATVVAQRAARFAERLRVAAGSSVRSPQG
jgi:hypothetical protein